MKKIAPHWQILLALVLATGTAIVFRNISRAVAGDTQAFYFIQNAIAVSDFVGKLFIQALKMIIVPLVASSIIAGIAGLGGVKGFGRLGVKTLGFYMGTSLSAVLVGLVLVNTIQPGLENGTANPEIRAALEQKAEGASQAEKDKVAKAGEKKAGDYADLFKKMIPANVIKAATENGQLLGMIFFSILFAIAMARLPVDHMRPLLGSIQAINDVMIRVTQWIMVFAPLGVFGLLLPTIFKSGPEIFMSLGKYFLTVVLALAIHLFVVMPLVLRCVARVNPWAHFRAMRMAMLTAFSTASSAATLPETMFCVQKNAGVSKRVSSFTLPLGATVNMDGTALYECVAVIFVAQVMGIDLSLSAQFAVVITALLTSIGVAGIPSASLVAILLILNSSGIPNAEMAVVALLAVDRLLDMSRTAVNIFGDSCAAVVIAKSEGEDLLVS
ncbi:MAG: dicarboxylate/amino acid:cation symporter [Verrucomicrobiae bacterium]|nr:dicarboxylate/amino acid:cation symporter [Verrucomicrobiae bacterium]NNJ43763.1 dicarboxylate/amino acid:cation symporter [Akkermansiaceae bacterium]